MTVDEVVDREKLVEYVRDLSFAAERGDIANASLVSFLAALSAWVDDMDGYFANLGSEAPQQPDWKLVAAMLSAACVYE